jgi:lysophospholipase L1-like esterase
MAEDDDIGIPPKVWRKFNNDAELSPSFAFYVTFQRWEYLVNWIWKVYMNRISVFNLTLIILLASCARPAADNFSAGTPLITASLPAVSTLTTTSIPQVTFTVTVVPSCEVSQKTSLKIMPLGDSITYGDGDLRYVGYRNLLGTLLTSDGYSIDFVGSQQSGEDAIPDPDNEGHPGWRIPNIKGGIDSEGWLETYQPDIILLHIGSNDLRYGNEAYAPDNLSALLDDILVRLPQTHIIVAQIIPTRWGSDSSHRLYNGAIPGIAASKGAQVSVVDMQNILSKSDFMTLYHPNARGYDKMAFAWESAILALNLEANCFNSE